LPKGILELGKYCYLGFNEPSQEAVRKIFRERFYPSCEEIDKLKGGHLTQFVLLYGRSDVDVRQLVNRLGNLLCCAKEQYHYYSGIWLTEQWEIGTQRNIDDILGPLIDVFQQASSSQELHLVVIDKIHEIFTSKSLSRLFWIRLKEFEKPSNVMLIATTTSYSELPGSIKVTYFDAEIKLDLPNTERRNALLQRWFQPLRLKNLLAEDVVLEHVIKETRGFDPCELEKCVEKAHSNAIARKFAPDQMTASLPEQTFLITGFDFSKAIKEIIEGRPLPQHHQPQFSYYL
jgi:vesicle-fusing ATPase